VETAATLLLHLLVGLTIVFAVIAAVQALTGNDVSVSIATVGDRQACALVPNEVVASATDVAQRGVRRDTATIHAEELEVCLEEPTVLQKAASALTPVGDLLFMVGALVLLRRVIRGGRTEGLFTVGTATRTRHLGYFLLFMTLVWPFVAAAGRAVVVTAAVPAAGWADMLSRPGMPIALALVALGVLTVARILRRAVVLQEEVDATV
jgi:hypothetical protein